jgi:hypothetical protein
MRRVLALLAFGPGWLCATATAAATVIKTLVGSAICATAATSCSGTFSTAVAAGSFVEIEVTVDGQAQSFVFSITDSAGNSYAGPGSGGKTTLISSNNGSIIVGYAAATTTALTTSSTFTVSNPSNSFPYVMQAYVIAGVSGLGGVGAAVTGTWTSGTPITFATTPTLNHSSEYADAVVALAVGGVTDSMGSYSGGFSAVGSVVSANVNRPEMFISGQTVTSGTATLVATPMSSASRNYSSIILYWLPTGAAKVGCGGSGGCSGLLGI